MKTRQSRIVVLLALATILAGNKERQRCRSGKDFV
jgi:hypothetical protein